ncbi:MAG: NUDIX domain-containing protein [Sandaracinaceae bacterium]
MVDQAYQLAYKAAYRVMRTYWKVRRPHTHGSLIAIWHKGSILLVRTSYLSYWNLPGGYVKRGETAKQAALRELGEEVGIHGIREADLEPVYDDVREWEGKNDHVEIFDLDVEREPRVEIDNREIVDARFVSPEQALRMPLFPPIAEVVRKRLSDEG